LTDDEREKRWNRFFRGERRAGQRLQNFNRVAGCAKRSQPDGSGRR
jgi:hypothetical protein